MLRLARPQSLGEMVPEAEEPEVGHLEDAADVRRLPPVEEEIGLGRVRVDAAVPLQEAERDEGIEKIERGSLVQPEALAQIVGRRRFLRQPREDLELDGAQ